MEAAVETRTFGINVDEVTAIDRWVEQVGAEWDQSERTIFGTRLCLAELAANVLEHGVAKPGADHIVVTLHRCRDGIGVEFLDSRAAFDPTSEIVAKTPAPTGSAAEGGRGLMLVRAYADEPDLFQRRRLQSHEAEDQIGLKRPELDGQANHHRPNSHSLPGQQRSGGKLESAITAPT